ncbi:transglycosylase SLT domain-containing protein [Marinobacteraceae bacterium S3BR75-40.1]
MDTPYHCLKRINLFLLLLFLVLPGITQAEKVEGWQDVIRNTPYWMSQGVAGNLETLRRWVLLGKAYCEQPNRHILYNRRGAFLTWMEDAESPEETQKAIDRTRETLAQEDRATFWLAGGLERIGYPFALACDQPHVDIGASIDRLLGRATDSRVWGTWDDLAIGSPDQKVPLLTLFEKIYEDRQAKGRYTFPKSILGLLLGQVIIESGVQKNAQSAAAAQGIMQLRPEVLSDCQIPKRLHYHRMVQIDCAYRLLEQNHRNLRGPFEARFGHLPPEKREALYLRLLLQAYHGGIGRVLALIGSDDTGNAARYFAQHQENFSARDIALGLIFHNLGRLQLGFASLYYATDVEIAAQAMCQSMAHREPHWCSEPDS